MKKNIQKKMIVCELLCILLGSTLVPLGTAVMMQTTTSKEHSVISVETAGSSSSGEVYKLLIITPKIFAKALQPLVEHKNNVNMSCRLATLDEVYDQMYWHGRDDAEKVKYFIKTAIEEWGIKYVLLVGGKKGPLTSWYFPVRYVAMDGGDGWDSEHLSDLYFADIYDACGNFSSWDSDGDGMYGEWQKGLLPDDVAIDLYPDVAVGRLPARNRFEVKIIVNKIIDYETKIFGQSWFKNIVVIAGDTYPECLNASWVGYEGEYYGNLSIENMTEFTPTRLFMSDGTMTGEKDVISTLSKGCGFVYFVGHGNPQWWANHPPNSTTSIRGLGNKNMPKLRNGEMLPVCVVSGCHNNQFDVSLARLLNKTKAYHLEGTPECWGWRMTRKIGGGSIATIGCTALGYTKEDKTSFKGGINELEVAFFKTYGQDNTTILGDTWKAALTWYLNTYPVNWSTLGTGDSWIDTKVVQTWALFGDPSLQIGGYS